MVWGRARYHAEFEFIQIVSGAHSQDSLLCLLASPRHMSIRRHAPHIVDDDPADELIPLIPQTLKLKGFHDQQQLPLDSTYPYPKSISYY